MKMFCSDLCSKKLALQDSKIKKTYNQKLNRFEVLRNPINLNLTRWSLENDVTPKF